MLKSNFKYILFLILLITISCAKRGSITGGLKDSLAPILKISLPKNFSTDFKGKEIKLTFDEYIKLKDLNKQLIISPPMKYEPIITPTNVSKYITIKITDTLQPNTTYSFNFGQSITDNNEGNVLNQFKYVFSTGTYIDSLTLAGTVKDAYNKEVESYVSVMLYEANDTFNDSIVYKENPRYITNTLDSLKTFKFENLKAGKYFLVAMKDYNNNNKFNPSKDKIGFKKQFITIPTDSVHEVKIFKETPAFKAYKPIQIASNRLYFPYQGKAKDYTITLKKGDTIVPTIITKLPKKDSLQVWFKTIKADSLSLSIKQKEYEKDFIFKIRKQKIDTLNIFSSGGELNLNDQFYLESTTPLVRFDNSKIKLINKDSVGVEFKTKYDEFNQKLFFDFKVLPSEKYKISVMPGAFTDLFEKSNNDTLVFKTKTRDLENYGNVKVNLINVKHFPVIVQLMNESGDFIVSEYLEENKKIDFLNLTPAKYSLRLIYDDNKNKEWDSGNYIQKRQAEEVIYRSTEIDVRANFDYMDEIFDLSIPYVSPSKKIEKKEKPKSTRY